MTSETTTRLAATCLAAMAAFGCLPRNAAAPAGPGQPAPSQEVQAPLQEMSLLEGLEWRLPAEYAKIDGGRLVVDIPADAYPADAVAEAELPAELFSGFEGFSMSVSAEGAGLRKPTKNWLGLKFQMHWSNSATGREAYPNSANELGDFATKTLVNEVNFGGAKPDKVTLMLGLQGTSGRVAFDLTTLRGAPSKGLFRLVNQDWKVKYPVAAAGTSGRRRGCMLPARDTTEDDIETLRSWGATLARFQIMRNWSGRDDNQDLEEYAAWIDSRLDNLEDVLRWAGARGMKIVIDLHTPPGGKRARDGQMNMFEDDRFADAWIDTWRRIATRFRGNPAIYGYDLINEPSQKERVRNDYWTLQRRAAETVRAIDPDTPIIIESDGSDAPAAYAWLSPLRMDNVIYQVHVYAPMLFTHQGVHGRTSGEKWPDPGRKWDKDFLRETLRPVREFALRHNARIYVGEFSAIAWAEGAENYLRDCIDLFEEYGWDWTYHAFREWKGWSVEYEGPDIGHMAPSEDNPRKRVLLEGFNR
ncbi:MAG: cellulase family glycosylhydrolase [Kiritimatiellae bacterium]|nr:cellulase family glycosylhydrolase [Kiritimatiellia bacterium]